MKTLFFITLVASSCWLIFSLIGIVFDSSEAIPIFFFMVLPSSILTYLVYKKFKTIDGKEDFFYLLFKTKANKLKVKKNMKKKQMQEELEDN